MPGYAVKIRRRYLMARETGWDVSQGNEHLLGRCGSHDRSRNQALACYRILDTMPETDFDDIAGLASTIFGSTFAAISFIDDDRQWFKAKIGLGICETPITESFCVHAVARDEMLVVCDASSDPLFRDKPNVIGDPHVRFYAGMPIHASDGTPIAALCVFDPEPRPQGINEAERTTLRVLAAQVETQLELRRAIYQRDEQAAVEREMSNELQFIAEHDALTGLPNRAVFQRRLTETLDDAGGSPGRSAIMLVDVDHFKQVNDAFGHDAGDALLSDFGARLRLALRATDTVARLGGDEFGVILHDIDAAGALDSICRSIDERLRRPLSYAGRLIECRASIGVAVYPDHAETVERLIKCADLALGAAKAQRGSIVLFRESIGDDFENEVALLAQARAALASNAVVPGYQPKVDLRTGKVVGFEALVRLRDGKGLCEHPSMFLKAFCNPELAAAIGERMITQVLDDVMAWSAAGVAFGHVAINSSAGDYAANDFAERLLSEIDMRGLDLRTIELEVTEDIFLGRGSHHVARALALLSSQGVRIALDDFGTGYASLSHLKQFPVDVLKIDRTFLKGVGSDAADTAIVQALIGLGQSLGVETVAEGVETVQQAAFVLAQGCCTAQGYLYGGATTADSVPDVVAGFGCARAA
jgi:diguanylate cyclase (GGDEF)-like protein